MAKDYEVTISRLLDEVADERYRQIERWGQQDHPSVYSEPHRRNFAQAAVRWKGMNDAREAAGTSTWDGILLEEVYEALAEEDVLKRRTELIQVAAVALAEIECLDRLVLEELEHQCPEEHERLDAEELVHNHGIDPSCVEVEVDGQLKGECLRSEG